MDDRSLLATWERLLTCRASQEDFAALDARFLRAGLVATWLVGMGRYWDDPGASLLQHVGAGSLIYVFALSALLWIVIAPLQPADWSYRRVLTFVVLTSPPAALYALPVERWFGVETAQTWNLAFLACVAVWRVLLLLRFLHVGARLSIFASFVGLGLPVIGIIVALTFLNLERAVFDVMGGFREHTAGDAAYAVLVMLTWLSSYFLLPVLLAYLALIAMAFRRKRKPRGARTMSDEKPEEAEPRD